MAVKDPNFSKISGAFFQEDQAGIRGVTDQSTLQKLTGGELAFEERKTLSDIFKVPPTSGEPVSVTDLELGQTDLAIPSFDVEDSEGFVRSLLAIYKTTPEETAAETTGKKLVGEAVTAAGELEKEKTRLAEEETKLEVPEDIKKLKEINLEIAGKFAEYEGLKKGLTKEGLTGPGFQARSKELERDIGIELGILNVRREALRGNIELSQNLAKRTVELEFGPKLQKIETAKTFLELNKSIFTSSEKKRAERIKAILDERERLVKEKSDQRKKNFDLAIKVAEAGGDFTLVDLNSTPESNLKKVGGFLKSAGGGFTKTQLSEGAVRAEMSFEEFESLPADTKRVFIFGDITGAKDDITQALRSEKNPISSQDLKSEIERQNVPRQVKDILLRHLERESLTVEERVSTKEDFAKAMDKAIAGFKGFGMSRTEAKNTAQTQAKKQMGLGEKDSLPDFVIDAIDDSLAETYGRTFFQKITPGGR